LAGHYLSTTNPEAAAAIGQERSGDLPDIGDLVVYYPRPGEMPGGIDRFPMLVMHVNHDGMVYGIAIAGINDERDVRAFRRSVESPAPAWDWPHQERRAEPTSMAEDAVARELDEYREKLDEVIKELNKLEGNTDRRLNRLEESGYKQHEPDLDADRIDRRLDRLEQELGLDAKPKPQREASPPARSAHKPAAKSKRKSKR
jgi:hypothetical protein